MRFGLIVNPIAGMGGSVGLKGTDGADTLAEAQARGAVPLAGRRARRALAVLAERAPETAILAAPEAMGADIAAALALPVEPLDLICAPGPEATRRAAAAMAEAGVDVLLLAGGDGTARDVVSAVGLSVPMLGIPCGVKMHSGVFAVTPEAAGRLLADLIAGQDRRIGYRKVEIMDIDEDLMRRGRLNARLYGYARAPHLRRLLQHAKATPPIDDEGMLIALGEEVAAELKPGVTYLIGPGTTAKRPLDALGLPGTLLGVDVLRDGALVATDVTAAEALAAVGEGPMHIIVGVTGGQGFVFGRGNQQIGADAIARCWPDAVTILASGEKLSRLGRPELLADTGDPDLDRRLSGYTRVRTGPQRSVMMRIV